MNPLTDRSEILFLFDASDINPNGDPLNENKPRMDEESGRCLISDVRLKRTVRDYLYTFKNQEIFVREIIKDDGTLKTKDQIVAEIYDNNPDTILERCIDLRLFGATLAIGGKKGKKPKKTDGEDGDEQTSITFTGPVQFRMGRSLHRVTEPQLFQGTTVMPSGEGKTTGTIRNEYLLPYGLFGFYGVVNQKAGEVTKLRSEDIPMLLDGLWNGTKNLITRSKVGQMPRLLIHIVYKDPLFLLGELERRIQVFPKTGTTEEGLRDIEELTIEMGAFRAALDTHKDRIAKVQWLEGDRATYTQMGQETTLKNLFEGLPNERLEF
jgi:CRISPR-associated protein Csh2